MKLKEFDVNISIATCIVLVRFLQDEIKNSTNPIVVKDCILLRHGLVEIINKRG